MVKPGRTKAAPDFPAETETAPESAAESGSRFRLGYRPELDGIRAIAVALVIGYHTGIMLLWRHSRWLVPGGFLGVDVFFVLSGFLITTLLLGEWERSGNISEPAFLRRRALRLVPALTAMLVIVAVWWAIAGWAPPSQAFGTIPKTLTYVQNWDISFLNWPWASFAFQAWSLAVEAQFYVGWSLLLVVLCRLRIPRWVVAVCAAVGVLASAWWRAADYAGGRYWQVLYTQTPARVDSLMVGAIAGVAAVYGWTRVVRPAMWRFVGVVGLVGVFALAWTMQGQTPALYQGLYTGVALVAAALILGAMFGGEGLLHDVLASRPFVAVGKLSYSLYLWHFPIFLSVREHAAWLQAPARLFVAWTLTFVMSALSYRFVELPFLRRKRSRPTAVEAEPRVLVASSEASL